MGLQFRKSIKIAPGLRINLSQKGASISLGTKGARLTASKKGITTTTGIPGTGISKREFNPWSSYSQKPQPASNRSLSEADAFKKHPMIMIVSVLFLAVAAFSLFIPEIPLWLFIPSLCIGIFFYVSARQAK